MMNSCHPSGRWFVAEAGFHRGLDWRAERTACWAALLLMSMRSRIWGAAIVAERGCEMGDRSGVSDLQ
jgi:hypothetical protein